MKLRIAFRYGDTRLFSRLVCLVRGGDSAHCEVVLRSVGGVHECLSASWVDGGVRVKKMPLPADKWRIWTLTGGADPLTWYTQHAGAPYDVAGLLGFVVPWVKHKLDAWFCSECAADIAGLEAPHRYDLVKLERHCRANGIREQ